MAAQVITVAIEKGGTGKTVTASNLAYLIGDEGKKVLCIDTDPQGNLTKALSGGMSITSDEFSGKALYNLFDSFLYNSKTSDFIIETNYENVDMIPCDAQTTRINKRIELLIEDSKRLKDGDPKKVSSMGAFLDYFIGQVRDDYDFVIIDTQPTRDSLLLSNAIYAADYVLIPAGCDDNSEESAFRLYYECNKMKQSSTSHLNLQDELGKIFAVGADHCFVMDSRDFVSLQNDISDSRSSYYIFPAKKEIDKYISTQLDNKMYPQISFYFSSEQIEIMQSLVIKQRIPKTIRNGAVKSYRYVIAGMLLNHPLCAELGASVN